MKNLYIGFRLYASLLSVVLLFLLSFVFSGLFLFGKILLLLLIFLVLADLVLLFKTGRVSGDREKILRFSNGDQNPVTFWLKNDYNFAVKVLVYDEVPFEFQWRNFSIKARLKKHTQSTYRYTLRPVRRGLYSFGKLNVFVRSPLSLLMRRFRLSSSAQVPTYPSFLQMRKYEWLAISHRLSEAGIKKIKKAGHHQEFEQIREYVRGDDPRRMNWKASARRHQLMLNQYQAEKSQPVYALIDKGRVMQMPFDGMTLLDYAINAGVVVTNIALGKHDKAGIVTFSQKVDTLLKAARHNAQMQRILGLLYNEKTDFQETDYAKLVVQLNRHLPRRSLLILYTNFESLPSLERQLPYLKIIARKHLLVVVFFVNTATDDLCQIVPKDTAEIYQKTIAEKFAHEKRQIVQILSQHGIHAILSRPENLTIDSLNKYLDIKSRGLI